MSRKHKKHQNQSLSKIEQLTDGQVLDVASQLRDESEVVTGSTCPFPGRPDMGDKDPEVMAWYRDNAPDEFARRYTNRVIPADLPEPSLESGPPTDFDEEEEPVKKPKVILE